jgi:hypothetical protein
LANWEVAALLHLAIHVAGALAFFAGFVSLTSGNSSSLPSSLSLSLGTSLSFALPFAALAGAVLIATYANGCLLSHTGFGVLDGGWAEKRQSGSCVLIMKDLIQADQHGQLVWELGRKVQRQVVILRGRKFVVWLGVAGMIGIGLAPAWRQ